jgi:tRNA nucleotidyltransferase (CCA-adding enzyme)
MHIILGHENADFDAIAAALAAHKLNPGALPILPDRLNANVARFLALYRTPLPFVPRDDIQPAQVDQITLVDTQRIPPNKGYPTSVPVHIVDHHLPPRDLLPHEDFSGDDVGAATTLLVEQLQAQSIPLTPIEATLLALGIYEDTGSLVYGETTPRDIHAAGWLVERGAVLDNVRRFLEPPLSDEQQALLETLVTTAESRTIQGYTVVVASATLDSYMNELSSVAHRLRDTLDPTALFLLVQMPSALHLVCRSTDDAVDSGAIARYFGGGGHERAAAATIRSRALDEVLPELWQQIEQSIQPAVRVGDLMSRGVQTLDPNARLESVITRMRRIGHEGYPVVEDGRVIGLLTRRDADRALEHGLGDLSVRQVMTAGDNALLPTDSLAVLENRMVESGWGQLPVVDDGSALIGIVTRTDLIKQWAHTKPDPAPVISATEIATVLGEASAVLIERIAQQAKRQHLNVYMVGGVVRDLILKRPSDDLDFVVEGDAIDFARRLQARYGGQLHVYPPFGTATLRLEDGSEAAPDHVDFASARAEFYEHPAALPTVYNSSIKLDLGRRDFTINTLALRLGDGRILDFYGGLADLRAEQIRVLHSLSFVDDPTRILRAVRFERRLGFSIEPRTAQLIDTALPMLRRITGERVRNELTLMLGEADPAQTFALLQARGILAAIHPAFALPDDLAARLQPARTTPPPWSMPAPDPLDVDWGVILVNANIAPADLPELCARLLFSKTFSDSIIEAARLLARRDLATLDMPPSRIVALLEETGDLALYLVWLLEDNALARERIWQYANEWRSVKPATNGRKLRSRGLKPGPCYARILTRLRAARLDGEISDDDGETRLLERLIQEGICDDGAR